MSGLTALTCSPSPVWRSGFTGSNLVAVDSAWLVGWDWLPWEQANSAGPGLAGRGETGITGSGETDFAGRSGSGFNGRGETSFAGCGGSSFAGRGQTGFTGS